MTANDVTKIDRTKAMKEMAVQLQPVPVGGYLNSVAMITPQAVQRLKLATSVSGHGRVSLPGPRLLEPRAEITFGISPEKKGVKALMRGVRLYDTGIIFPDTETPSDHFKIVEIDIGATLHKTYLEERKGEIIEESMEKRDLILTALGRDRYWLAIPSNVYPDVSITKQEQGNNGTLQVILINRDYAQRFIEINSPFKSKWFDTKHRKMSVTGYVIIGLSAPLLFGLAVILGVKNVDWIFVTILILIGIGSYFAVRSLQGEQI